MGRTMISNYCFHQPKKIFNIDGVEYYAASASGVSDFKGDFVVNLSGHSNLPPMRYSELSAEFDLNFEEELMVPWPDFGIPSVKVSFWPKLHKFICSRGWTSVCIHCQAGHGRTGTALSALLITNIGYSAYDAVNKVRSLHCGKCVETFSQVRYLQFLDTHYNNRDYSDEPTIVPADMFKEEVNPNKFVDSIDAIEEGSEDEEDLSNIIWEEDDGDVESF
jgi:hypothetical protein